MTSQNKSELFTAYTSATEHNFPLNGYRRFADSPRFQSEWDENFGPRSALKDETVTSVDTMDSPLAKKIAASYTAELPSPAPKTGAVRIMSPAKEADQMNASVSVNTTYGKADLAAPTPVPVKRELRSMDVFWSMINDITGKDKLAKFGQYSLRLLLFHARKSQSYLSDEKVNIKVISQTYASNEKIFSLLVNFVHDPRSFARVVGILVCSVFTSRCAALVPALATFRQLLRFGKSPFRIRSLWTRIRDNVYFDAKSKQWRLREALLTRATISDAISLYYSANDEALLLFKLKFLRNPTWKSFAGRHEAYAWYCDSWFTLYNTMSDLLKLSQQEMETRILIQVRQRSRVLSKQILGSSAFHGPPATAAEDDDRDATALNEIRFKITNAKLDILKLISDIVFNSYTVFNYPLHFETVQIWTGISASFLSSVKLYREKRRYLERR